MIDCRNRDSCLQAGPGALRIGRHRLEPPGLSLIQTNVVRERDENQFRSDEKIVLLLPEPFHGFSIWSKYELSFVSLIFISVVFGADTDSVGTRNQTLLIRSGSDLLPTVTGFPLLADLNQNNKVYSQNCPTDFKVLAGLQKYRYILDETK